MDMGFKIPWIGRGFDMPYMGGVNIPWVRVRYDMDRRFDIPWLWVKIPWVGGLKKHG